MVKRSKRRERARALGGEGALALEVCDPRLQPLLWREGYHHAQVKSGLRAAGQPIRDEEAGPLTWDVWKSKKMAD